MAIDEALGLAKTLCADDAPSFIHGLLSAVCADKSQIAPQEDAAERTVADTSAQGDGPAGAPSDADTAEQSGESAANE